MLAETPARTLVVVDSFGSLYAEQVEHAGEEVPQATASATGKEVGMHAHNNQQLAFANTIEAIIHGANRVDATMAGLGRGAGNCPMELLIGFLRNPKFKIRPIYEVLQNHLLPLSREGRVGAATSSTTSPASSTSIPAAPSPPAPAIAATDYVDFYDKLISDV